MSQDPNMCTGGNGLNIVVRCTLDTDVSGLCILVIVIKFLHNQLRKALVNSILKSCSLKTMLRVLRA